MNLCRMVARALVEGLKEKEMYNNWKCNIVHATSEIMMICV